MVDIVQNIYSFAKKIYNLKKKLSEADRQKRIDIADYLNTLSKILLEVHDSLQQDRVPHGKCSELEHHAINMPNVISDKIVENVLELSQMLQDAHTLEWGELNKSQNKNQELNKIAEAAGWLRGTATTIRAGGKL